jgi:hypothetical protein
MSHVATLLQIVGVVGVVLSLAVWSPVFAGLIASVLVLSVGIALERQPPAGKS